MFRQLQQISCGLAGVFRCEDGRNHGNAVYTAAAQQQEQAATEKTEESDRDKWRGWGCG